MDDALKIRADAMLAELRAQRESAFDRCALIAAELAQVRTELNALKVLQKVE